mgnify:CR=1 FL=1
MNSILIVLPILTLLMFDLGLSLEFRDFLMVLKRPRAMFAGMLGQLVLLPLIAYILTISLHLEPTIAIGIMLIACCPGGSSSNVFSKLAGGDVALSVSLTAVSSIVTLVTMPLIMQQVTEAFGKAVNVTLPVGNLLVQNLVTMLIPIIAGILIRRHLPLAAKKISSVLSKMAFPLLMLLAGLFFIGNRESIISRFCILGGTVTTLLLVSIGLAALLCISFKLATQERRTIIIEVGMQNAAQAIAVATSPFIFNDPDIAMPAIIYALMMNVVLLIYVSVIKVCK